MTIHINSTTYQCPLCSAPAQNQTFTESCILLPAGATTSAELILQTCVRSAALKEFLEDIFLKCSLSVQNSIRRVL